MIEQEELLEIGFVSKPHGFKGELQLVLFTEDRLPKKLEFLFIWMDHGPVPFFIERLSQSGSVTIVKFEDVDNEKMASGLSGQKLFIEKRLAAKEQLENAHQSLYQGFTLVDKTKGEIGILESLIVSGTKKIFVIRRDGKEILIPAEKPIWVKTDKMKKIIHLNLPEGLLEVYS